MHRAPSSLLEKCVPAACGVCPLALVGAHRYTGLIRGNVSGWGGAHTPEDHAGFSPHLHTCPPMLQVNIHRKDCAALTDVFYHRVPSAPWHQPGTKTEQMLSTRLFHWVCFPVDFKRLHLSRKAAFYHPRQWLATFPVQDQTVTASVSVGDVVSDTTAEPCYSSAITGEAWTARHGCLPLALYFQKEEAGRSGTSAIVAPDQYCKHFSMLLVAI